MAINTEWQNLGAGDIFNVDGCAWYTVQNLDSSNTIGIAKKDSNISEYTLVAQAYEEFYPVANQAYKGEFKILNTGGGTVNVRITMHKLIADI